MKLVGISGSLIGTKVSEAVHEVLSASKAIDKTIQVELIDLKEHEIEFFHGPSLAYYSQETWDLVNTITSADLLVIGSPIYQASISGVLKNLLDFMPQDAFRDKVTGIVTVGGSEKHFLVAEYQLKPILSYLKGIVPINNVFIHNDSFDEENTLVDEGVLRRIQKLAKEMISTQRKIKE